MSHRALGPCLFGPQQPHLAALLHAARLLPGFLAVAPIEVGPRRAADGGAGVLGEHQPLQRPVGRGIRGGQEHRRAQRHETGVHRHRTLRRQSDAVGALGPLFRINHGFLAEEHHGRVGIEHFRHALRVALRPGADVLHGGLVGRQFAPVDQPAANGRVGLAVVIGVGHADGLARIGAVGQQHAARTLHLQKEVVHRIVHPHQHGRTAARGLDGGAGVVGHDALAVELAAHALAGQFRIHRPQVDGQQVRRHGVQRPLIGAALPPRTAHQRLVIAGDGVRGRLAVGGIQPPGLQIGLQEAAHALVARRRARAGSAAARSGCQARGVAGRRGQVAAGGPHQPAAIADEQRPELRQVVVAPAGISAQEAGLSLPAARAAACPPAPTATARAAGLRPRGRYAWASARFRGFRRWWCTRQAAPIARTDRECASWAKNSRLAASVQGTRHRQDEFGIGTSNGMPFSPTQ